MRFKGDSKSIAITLLSAAVVGAATGLGVAHMSWPKAIAVAIVAGLAAGGLLYVVLSIWMRRRPK